VRGGVADGRYLPSQGDASLIVPSGEGASTAEYAGGVIARLGAEHNSGAGPAGGGPKLAGTVAEAKRHDAEISAAQASRLVAGRGRDKPKRAPSGFSRRTIVTPGIIARNGY
jgi:hypothetical protein